MPTQIYVTITATIERTGEREFRLVAEPDSFPEQLPADMADWVKREYGIDVKGKGGPPTSVVPTEDWSPGHDSGGDS